MRKSPLISTTACISLLASQATWGQETRARHGTIPAQHDVVAVESGISISYQTASDSRIQDSAFTSFDMVASLPSGNGEWLFYIEGNTSPQADSVSALLGEANADAGTALDRDAKGRLQVSALHYLWYLDNNAIVAGLLDPAGPLDNSNIANDETSQFISTTLVNNPTIAFPDYTIGIAYFMAPENRNIDLTFLVSGSHGLADNPNASYSELVDLTETGKGIFTAFESIYRTGNHDIRLGIWFQSANNDYLDASGNTGNNYGIYTSSDHVVAGSRVNLRLGLANDKVSEAAGFIGLALEHSYGENNMGIGITRTFVSEYAGPGKDDSTQIEIYYRFNPAENLSLTPSIQQIKNSNFDNTNTSIDNDVNVMSIRATYTF